MEENKFVLKIKGENPKLKEEKIKAMKTLKTSSKLNILNQGKSLTPKSPGKFLTPKSPELNLTDCASYRWKDTFDISATDKTINLESFNKTSNTVTFDHSEITGRSTSCNIREIKNMKGMSTEQILASSCSEKIRCLSHSLSNGEHIKSQSRTADTSKSSIRNSLPTSNTSEFLSPSEFKKADGRSFAGENFVSMEKFLPKLSADEKEWEKEFAAIPTEYDKKLTNNKSRINNTDSLRSSTPEPEMSMGTFFQIRSADLQNIMSNPNSPKKHKPIALIDDSDLLSERENSELHTYGEVSTNSNKGMNDENRKQSYHLTVSAIANALNDMNLDTSTSVINYLMGIKGTLNQHFEIINNYDDSLAVKDATVCQDINDNEEIENKENIAPKSKPLEFCDTASFTESLLENSSTNKCVDDINEISQRNVNTGIVSFNQNLMINSSENQSISNEGKSRKRPHSAIQGEAYSYGLNKSADCLKNFRKKFENYLPPVRENLESNKHVSTTEQIGNNLGLSLSASKSYSGTETQSLTLCPQHSTSNISKSPSSNESTIKSDQKFLNVPCSPLQYGKYSLPNFDVFSRVSSTSNLSTKSGNSEYSQQEERLPLKATCINLTWGSVKLRKTVQKSVQIKNTSHKKIIVRAEIRGPGFQIVSHEQSGFLTLHSQECRTITLSFCPTVIGAAVGQLKFSPSTECSSDKQMIGLYGYGGHSSIIPQGVMRGPVGPPFLAIAELKQLSRFLTKSFTLYNKGSLIGFAILNVDSIGLDVPRLCDSIEINPKKVVIYPQSEIKISVTFRPRRDDIKKIMKKITNVITLAKIRIICGDEPTRHRIRKLIKNMNETEKLKISNDVLDYIWMKFPGESLFNLDTLKEGNEAVVELLETLKTHEIALTLNHLNSLDETIETTLIYPECDETVMFRTIFSNVPEKDNESLYSTAISQNIIEMWSVTPHALEIDPIVKNKANFTISNKFCKEYDFVIETNFKGLFEINPKEGTFYPEKDVEVTVTFTRPCALPTQDIFIHVLTESSKLTVPVKIKKENYPSWSR